MSVKTTWGVGAVWEEAIIPHARPLATFENQDTRHGIKDAVYLNDLTKK